MPSREMALIEKQRVLATKDIKLAACLMACGVPLDTQEPVTFVSSDGGRSVRFNFMPAAINGQFTAQALMRAWAMGDAFIKENPEHPISYLMACWRNYMGLRDYVKELKPLVMLQKGKSIAVVDPNSPQAIQDKILQKIGI